MMFFGLLMVASPLSVVLDVLPILGDIASVGTGLIAFVLALVLTLVTIGIAWLAARPVMGVAMLVAAGVVITLGVMAGKKRKAKAKAAGQ
jgi:high-affinity Fe2+/Pb2+ permease